jgi:hypothetical protein
VKKILFAITVLYMSSINGCALIAPMSNGVIAPPVGGITADMDS